MLFIIEKGEKGLKYCKCLQTAQALNQLLLHTMKQYQFIENIFPSDDDMLLLLLLSHFSRVRLCATLQTATHQAPLPMGILQARMERVAMLPPGHLPKPGMEPRSPTLQVESLLSEPPGSPVLCIYKIEMIIIVSLPQVLGRLNETISVTLSRALICAQKWELLFFCFFNYHHGSNFDMISRKNSGFGIRSEF